MLQTCASECVNNRTYRTLQETCDEGASCSSSQGSEALIGSLHIQALPTNRKKTRTCCCTCSCYKILCCNMPSDKNFLRKRACVRPRFKEHCAGPLLSNVNGRTIECRDVKIFLPRGRWLTLRRGLGRCAMTTRQCAPRRVTAAVSFLSYQGHCPSLHATPFVIHSYWSFPRRSLPIRLTWAPPPQSWLARGGRSGAARPSWRRPAPVRQWRHYQWRVLCRQRTSFARQQTVSRSLA